MNYIIFAIAIYCLQIYLGKKYLNWIEKKNYVQPLLTVGPDHSQKQGTPTMGGISFIMTILICCLIGAIVLAIGGIAINFLPIVIFVLCAYAYIGYRDDIQKVTKNDNEQGLSPKQKLFAQFVIALLVIIYLLVTNYEMVFTIQIIDFVFPISTIFSAILYSFVLIFLFVGVSNATNLTDGLDGLLASTYISGMIPIAIIAYNQNSTQLFSVSIIVIFALFGFLKYNSNPAKMFMGDTGSLALGALLVMLCVLLHIELMVFFFGFVFMLETISVIMQVLFFKYTKKKYGKARRLFLMAPYHHHLEKKGYSEKRIVFILCIVQIVSSSVGLLVYFV